MEDPVLVSSAFTGIASPRIEANGHIWVFGLTPKTFNNGENMPIFKPQIVNTFRSTRTYSLEMLAKQPTT